MTHHPFIGVCGDVHGHLQLAACAWALEQQRTGRRVDAILLCGDVGTFPRLDDLDRATLRHARDNPCEIEFPQWASDPPPAWLEAICSSPDEGGLGLDAPMIMVHGNHEGWDHLEELLSELPDIPPDPVAPAELPAVDARGRLRLLPSGWRVTVGDVVVGGIGGIQPGQRAGAGYPPLAYIEPAAVEHLRRVDRLDVLITHQGPAQVQGGYSGATILDPLVSRDGLVWFHGHSRARTAPMTIGTATVVPLGDATFGEDGRVARDGWHRLERSRDVVTIVDRAPAALNELAAKRWIAVGDRGLVAPHLAAWIG